MTDDTMRILEIVQKSDDGDFLKTIAETTLQRIMDADVENIIGAHATSVAPSGSRTATVIVSGRWKPGLAPWS